MSIDYTDQIKSEIAKIKSKSWKKKNEIQEIWARVRHTADSRQAFGCLCGENDCPGYAWVDYTVSSYDPDAFLYGTETVSYWEAEDGQILLKSPQEWLRALEYQLPSTSYNGPQSLKGLKK